MLPRKTAWCGTYYDDGWQVIVSLHWCQALPETPRAAAGVDEGSALLSSHEQEEALIDTSTSNGNSPGTHHHSEGKKAPRDPNNACFSPKSFLMQAQRALYQSDAEAGGRCTSCH